MQAENGMPENEDVKKKALLRLAVAGVVTAAALGGLWWLDQSDSKKPPVAEAPPAPIVSAPPPEVAAPQTEVPETESEVSPTEDEAAPEELPVEAPPPPKVSNNLQPPRAQPSPQPAFPSQVTPRPAAVSAARPTSVPVATAPVAEPIPQGLSGKSYVVQLGVFSNPDNARELVTKLNKQGIRAHMEARVQLGPFLNRQEAEKAQIEMRKLGYNALVTLPYSVVPNSVPPAMK
jgi:DedD protein